MITRKDEPETVDGAALARAADAVATVTEPLVVVHGAGSFGHHHAERAGVSDTEGTHDPAAIDAVHGAMKRLNRRVLAALHDRDVPAVPVHPLSVAYRASAGEDRAGRPADVSLPSGAVETLLVEGFVPVLHGDLIAQAGRGTTVVSGDDLVVSLARSLDADRVGLCSTVPGVLRDGDVIDRIDSYGEVADVLGESDATDVTGGMAGKVRALLDLGTPASVFGLDDLPAFLVGEPAGTLIAGGADP